MLHLPDVEQTVGTQIGANSPVFVLSTIEREDMLYAELLDPASDPSNESALGWILARLGDRSFLVPCTNEREDDTKDDGEVCSVPLPLMWVGEVLGLSSCKQAKERESSSEKRNFLATFSEVKRDRKNEGGGEGL